MRKCHSKLKMLWTFLTLIVWCAIPASAQDDTKNETAAPDVRRVFVPMTEIEAVINRDKKGVLLDREEFAKLYQQAKAVLDNAPNVPAPIVMTQANYAAEFVDSQLLLSVEMQFQQFVDGWKMLTLPVRNLSVETATIDDQPAKVSRSAKPGELTLFHLGKGKKTLKLTLSAPVTTVGSDKVVAFGLLPAPAATLNVKVPARKHLLLDELTPKRPAADNEATTYELAVGGRTAAQLKLTESQNQQSTDSLVFASTGYGINVAPGEVTWQAVTQLQLFGRAIDQFEFSIPNALEIAAVESTGLESWDLNDADQAGRTSITLRYRQPVEGSRKITFRGVMATASGEEWIVPGLRLADVSSHVGQLVIQHPYGTRLLQTVAEGARPSVNSRQSGDGNIRVQYDLWQEAFRLGFVTELRQRELFADLSTILEASETGVDLESIVSLECLNAPLFEIDLRLPADWTVVNVTQQDKPVDWKLGQPQAGEHRVLVTPLTALQPGQKLALKLTARRESNQADDDAIDQYEFALPQVGVPQANVVEGAYLILTTNDFEMIPADLQGLDPAAIESSQPHLGFRYQDTAISGRLTLQRKPARTIARTMSFTRVDREALRTHFDIRLEIYGGGSRTIQIQLPEETGTNLRFHAVNGNHCGASIVSQSAGDAENGLRTWTLQLDRRALGILRFGVAVETARTDATTVLNVPRAVVQDADRQSGYVAIEAAAEQFVSLDFGDAAPLAVVDAADLPASAYTPQERIVAAHQFVSPDYAITLNEQRFERQAVPTAVIQKSNIRSTVAETGAMQHVAWIRFVAVGVQALQLELADGELWSVVLDDEPVEVRRSGNFWRIPLPRADQADEPRELKLSWASQTERLGMVGRIQQQPPRLSVVNGDESLALEALDQKWTLFYPNGTMLVASNGRFEPAEGTLSQPGLLYQLRQLVYWPSFNKVRGKTTLVVVTTAVIFLVSVVIPRWKRSEALTLLKGLLVVALVALFVLPFTLSSRMRSSVDATSAPATKTAEPMEQMANDAPAFGSPQLMFDEEMPMEQAEVEAAKALNSDALIAGQELSRAFEAKSELESPDRFGQPVAPAKKMPAGVGSRLSVNVNFQHAVNQSRETFRYAGAGDASAAGALVVSFQDRETSLVLRLAVAIAVGMIFWIFRKAKAATKCMLAVIFLAIPIAALALVPVRMQLIPEGILLGALGGIALWLIRGVIGWLECGRNKVHAGMEKWKTTSAALLILSVATASPAVAQQTRNPANNSANKPAVHMGSDKDDSVIVPFNPGEIPLMAPNVFLSHDQFLRLWNAANPAAQKHAPPGIGAIVSTAAWNAKLVQDGSDARVEVTGRIVLDHFVNTPTTVRLPFGRVALSSATISGPDGQNQPAAIRVTAAPANAKAAAAQKAQQKVQQRQALQNKTVPEPSYELTLAESGTHVLDVAFDLPAKVAGPSGQFSIPLRPTAGALLTFEQPAADVEIRVNQSSAAFRKRSVGDKTLIDIPADQAGTITVNWQPAAQRGANESIVHVATANCVSVDDAGLRLRAVCDYQVRQGSLTEAEFKITDGLRLQRVTGNDVGGWELPDNSDTLKIFLRRAVDDVTQIQIELFQPLSVSEQTTQLVVPQLSPLRITRDTGTVAVFAGSQFVVRAGPRTNVSQINPSTFKTPAAFSKQVTGRPVLAWKYAARPFSIATRISRRAEESLVNASHAARVELRRILLTSLYDFELRGAARSRMAFRLPTGMVPTDVNATALADWYLYEDNGRVLVVEFAQPQLGRTQVTLAGFVPRAAGDENVSLETPAILNPDRLESRLGVWFDDLFRGTIVDAGVWKTVAPNTLPTPLLKLQPVAPRFALSSRVTQTDDVTFRLERVKPDMIARSATMITASDFSNDYTINLKWSLPTGAADTLVFTGPDWLAGRLTFQIDGLRQQTETAPENGRIRWVLTLQEPVRGDFFGMAIASMPPSDTVPAPLIEFEEQDDEQFTPLTTQSHFAVLVNQSTGTLTAANPDAVVAAERTDLPIRMPEELLNQATEIVRMQAPLNWTIRRVTAQSGAPASVNLADLATIIAADGSWRAEGIYTVRNRARQFLPLIIPEKSRLLSVFVKDQPARPVLTERNGKTMRLIALPRTSEADLSFQVRVVLAGELAGYKPNQGGPQGQNLSLPVPQIPSLKDDAEFGIPVIRTRWKVWVPEDWDASPVDDPALTNLTRDDSANDSDLYVAAAAQEAQELLSVFESRNISRNQRLQARDNLMYLGDALEDYDGSKQQGLREKVESLQRRIIEAQEQLPMLSNSAEITGNGLVDVDAINRSNMFNNDQILDLNKNAPTSGTGVQLFNFSLDSSSPESAKSGKKRKAPVPKPSSTTRDTAQKGEQKASGGKVAAGRELQSKRGLLEERNRRGGSLSQLKSQFKSRSSGRQGQSAAGDLFGDNQQPATQDFRRFNRTLNGRESRSGGENSSGGDIGGMAPGSAGSGRLGGAAVGGRGQGAGSGGFGGGGFGGGNGAFGGFNNQPQDQAAGGMGMGFGMGSGAQSQSGQATPSNRNSIVRPGLVNGPVPQTAAPAQQQSGGQQGVSLGLQNDMSGEATIVTSDGNAVYQTVQPWKRAGGLSLEMDLPRVGREFTFTRVNGDPKLTFVVRPRATRELGLGILWAVAWLVAALVIATAIARRGAAGAFATIPPVIAAIALLAVFLLPTPYSSMGYVAFLIAAICMGVNFVKKQKVAAG